MLLMYLILDSTALWKCLWNHNGSINKWLQKLLCLCRFWFFSKTVSFCVFRTLLDAVFCYFKYCSLPKTLTHSVSESHGLNCFFNVEWLWTTVYVKYCTVVLWLSLYHMCSATLLVAWNVSAEMSPRNVTQSPCNRFWKHALNLTSRVRQEAKNGAYCT